jgi:LEA14-like dessication related protein
MADTKKGSVALIVTLIGVGLLIVGGVGGYLYNQYRKLTDFCVKMLISKVKVNALGITKIDITLPLQLENKSDITATVDGYVFDILVNENKVSTAYSNEFIEISPKGYSVVEINIVFNPLQILQIGLANVADLLNNRERVKIKITGNLIGLKSVIKLKKLPITYETDLKELTTDTGTDESTCK